MHIRLILVLLMSSATAVFSQTEDKVLKQDISNCKKSYEEETLFKMVERMPAFKGCEGVKQLQSLNKCNSDKLKSFIKDHSEYSRLPTEGVQKEGLYVSFVVEPDGCLSTLHIRRSLNDNCDEVVANIFKSMPMWSPGLTNNKPVRVMQKHQIFFSPDIE